MSATVVVGNESFKRRSPVAVWIGLPLITVGIYYVVWWYKINNEARRFLRDESIKPALSTLAITVGGVLLVPPLISTYRTTERIGRMQQRAGLPDGVTASPWLSVILTFLFGLSRLYMQTELNRVWDWYLRAATSQLPALPPGTFPLPPAVPPAMPPTPPG